MTTFTHLIRLLPLATSSAALMCSAGQQIALTSFLHPSIPASSRHALFYPWIASYSRVVYLSAPCQLATMLLCTLNLLFGGFAGTGILWMAGLLLTLGHAYPVRLGIKLAGVTEGEWGRMGEEEGVGLVRVFVGVNGWRLGVVDGPGWVCVCAAVVMSGRS